MGASGNGKDHYGGDAYAFSFLGGECRVASVVHSGPLKKIEKGPTPWRL